MSDHFKFDVKPSQDRRKFGRRTVCKPAKIVCAVGDVLVGVVVDLSDQGAGLEMSTDAQLPEQFELLIQVDDTITLCRLAYQTGKRAGVEFLRSPRKASRATIARMKSRRLQLARILSTQTRD